MTKVFKILGRILGITLEWILILIIALFFLIRLSQVQTFLAQKATAFLSDELNTTIHIEKVSIVFIDKLALDGVFILDQQKDTLANIGTLYATLDHLDLKNNFLRLKKIELNKGVIHINRDKNNGDYNYWFLTDYFASGKTKKKKEAFSVQLGTLVLKNINFKYDDFRKTYSKSGMDYDHISVKDIALTADNFSSKNGVIKAQIRSLKAKEKCGFVLDHLHALVSISKQGLKLKEVKIHTPKSKIYAPRLHLLLDSMDDFQTFEDSVAFDAYLAKSIVSLNDIAFFAPELEGMHQKVSVSGTVSRFVKNLKIEGLQLEFGEKSILQGTLNLPDFRNFEKSFFNEKIDYLYLSLKDLQDFSLPNSSKGKKITLDKYLLRLGDIQAVDLRIDGFYSQFVVKADYIRSQLGDVKMDNGIMLTENKANNSYFFERSQASIYDIKIEKFQLGKFLNNNQLGVVDGQFFLSGEAFSLGDIRFNKIEGNLNRLDYMGYAYNDIFIKEGSFVDQKFIAKIDVKDDNLNLTYDGFIDFKNQQHMKFSVDVGKAVLDNLGFSEKDSTSLRANVQVELFGKNTNTIQGNIILNDILFKQGERQIALSDISIIKQNNKETDLLEIKSSIADARLVGKMDFENLIGDFKNLIQSAFPIIQDQKYDNKRISKSKNYFDYQITTKSTDDLFAIFIPGLSLEANSTIKGFYYGKDAKYDLDFNSNHANYKNIDFQKIHFNQKFEQSNLLADLSIKRLVYSDSIEIDDVQFQSKGTNKTLDSYIKWHQNGTNASLIDWETEILSKEKINFKLNPSYISINDQRWDIENQSLIAVSDKDLNIQSFKIQHNEQFIKIDGLISGKDSDQLNFSINEFDLEQFSSFIGSKIDLKGKVNAWGYVSNPYNNPKYMGDLALENFVINERPIGDVYVQTGWDPSLNSIGVSGDIKYRGIESFHFEGNYFTKLSKDNLNIRMDFEKTDVQFANALIDPKLFNNIKGLLDGQLTIGGTLENPVLKGEVELINGNMKMEMLGVNFGMNGVITADESGMYIDNMPITDEEGNTGTMVGTVFHNHFKDWNFDLNFDLERDYYNSNSPLLSGYNPALLDKFLVLNTNYKEGEYYYGKGYGTGIVNIFGYLDNIEITIDLETEKGTAINFPMYGVSEIEEDESLIRFVSYDSTLLNLPPEIDFTGIDLDLNFKVTPDAKLKIVFNELLGDEISAEGNGNVNLKIDNLGDLSMEGSYKIKDGLYNFAMGPIKKKLFIEEGGTINWIGDPYSAILDVKAYHEVNTSLSDLSPDQFSSSMPDQKVLCYIELKELLTKPTINFDIKAPKADEVQRNLLSRVTSNGDELNRQFFSLMLTNRFQPIEGSVSGGGSAALDLVANQINSILADVSKDYKLNVDLESDNVSGENSVAVGVSKGFMEDRLMVTGKFGVENNNVNQSNQSAFIGDISIEYLLNEDGTFRVTLFNESNRNTVLVNNNGVGAYTQGVSLYYQEEFNKFEDFKLAQKFINIFRKSGNKKYFPKRKKRRTKLPPLETLTSYFIIPDKQNISPKKPIS